MQKIAISIILSFWCIAIKAQITPPSGTILCTGGSGTTTYTCSGTSGGTWSSSASTVTIDPSSGIITGMSPGTVTISYLLTATLTVYAPPVAITGTPTVCVGSTTVLSDASIGGVWYSTATSIATIDPVTGTVGGISQGTAIISYNNGCGTAATLTVTVNALPATITGSQLVCIPATSTTGTTTLSETSTGGTWSSSATTIATVDPFGDVTGLAQGTSVITYSGCGTNVTAIVTVNDEPATISGTRIVCIGSTTELAEIAASGVWSSSATSVATIDPVYGIVTGEEQGTAIITYDNGCAPAATVTVTVNAPPAIITGTANVCVGSTSVLTETSTGGVWTSSSTTIATVDPFGDITGVSQGIAVITYSGCGSAANFTVSVNAAPATITGTTTVCTGLITELTETSTGGIWSSSSTTIATVDPFGDVTGVSPGTASITYSNGCGTNVNVNVLVNLTPVAIAGLPSSNICIGNTAALTDATTGGVWYPAPGSGDAATVASTGVITGFYAGTTTVSYTLSGCSAYLPVTVNTNTVPTITGGGAGCIGQFTQLNDVGDGDAYTWSSSNTAIATVNSSTGLVEGIEAGTAVITYNDNVTECFKTQNITIHNLTINPITGLLSPWVVCIGNTVQLSDYLTGGVWYPASSSGDAATVSSTGVITGNSTGTVIVSYTINGCSAYLPVTVNTNPVASISGFGSGCVDQYDQLNDATTTPDTYTWSSSNTLIATVSTAGLVDGVSNGTAVITYSDNVTGCFQTRSITIYSVTPDAITGSSTVCTGNNISLSDATPYGLWYPSGGAIVSVNDDGVVTGVAGGTAIVTYEVSGCSAYWPVTVNNIVISGNSTVEICSPYTFTDPTSGGTWSSTNTSKATVNSSGVVTGVSAGSATIKYAVSGCATAATYPITVDATCERIRNPNINTGTSTKTSVNANILEDNAYSIYPNPSSAEFTLSQAEPADGLVAVKVTNYVGATIFKGTINFAGGIGRFSLPGVAPGVYMVEINDTKGAVHPFKVIIE